MMKKIDEFLNTTTMYRLVLYYLIYLLVIACVLGLLGWIPYSPWQITVSTAVLLILGWATNYAFAWSFQAPANVESVYITALILALIVNPTTIPTELVTTGWIVVIAMASKYLLSYRKKHLFNPAAVAIAISAFAFRYSASWWVGTAAMLPFVVIPGWLIVRKIRRTPLVVTFFVTYFVVLMAILFTSSAQRVGITLRHAVIDSPLFFFAFVMLTEPLTMPAVEQLQIIFAVIVGVLFVPTFSLFGYSFTPEQALIIGNLFAYLVSSKTKLILTLKSVVKLGSDMYDFVFEPDEKLRFRAGQYLEWTLPHDNPDNRGNRRYFTIASAPHEHDIRVGVKFYPRASSYKKNLASLKKGDTIAAGQLAGDFTLPHDTRRKLVLIAGGIGITPYESIVQDLLYKKEKRDIVLVYANSTIDEIAYKNTFDRAEKELGIKTLYVLSNAAKLPPNWTGESGHITSDMIRRTIPDYRERTFYVSGSHGMVVAVEQALAELAVPSRQLVTDYFPGFA